MINITPLVFLIVEDILGLNKLWGERFFRRVLHHLNNNSYNYNKTLWIQKMKDALEEKDINEILTLELPDSNGINTKSRFLSNLVGGQYSKRSILYYNDFDDNIKYKLDNISNKLKDKIQKIYRQKVRIR